LDININEVREGGAEREKEGEVRQAFILDERTHLGLPSA